MINVDLDFINEERKTKHLQDIAEDLGISRYALRRLIIKLENQINEDEIGYSQQEVPVGKYKVNSIPKTVNEALEIWNEFIGYDGNPPKAPKHKTNNGSYTKIVCANDFHSPFYDPNAVKALIDDCAHDTDILVINGDLQDLFASSRYDKYKQHYSISEEFRITKALLNLLSSKFKKVIVVTGNHDERYKKSLVQKRGMSPSELEAMNLLGQLATNDETFKITDPLYCLTRDLPNVHLAGPVVKDYAEFNFFHQIGDVIFSHAEKFSVIPGQAANQSVQWFQSYGISSGIVRPFKLLCQAHTHQLGIHYGNFGVWCAEVGKMCLTPDYASDAKLLGAPRNAPCAYTVIYQDKDGVTDMTKTRIVPIL